MCVQAVLAVADLDRKDVNLDLIKARRSSLGLLLVGAVDASAPTIAPVFQLWAQSGGTSCLTDVALPSATAGRAADVTAHGSSNKHR